MKTNQQAKKIKKPDIFNHDQLHMAISLYLAACFNKQNERTLWKPVNKYIDNGKVPPVEYQGRMMFIKDIKISSIIIFAYAIENLFKAFLPEIKKRHISVIDFPTKLNLNEIEALMILKTILPLLKNGLLRYPEPQQEEYFLSPNSAKSAFIKIFKYYIKKLNIKINEIKCFKLEFLKYKYPFIEELI